MLYRLETIPKFFVDILRPVNCLSLDREIIHFSLNLLFTVEDIFRE